MYGKISKIRTFPSSSPLGIVFFTIIVFKSLTMKSQFLLFLNVAVLVFFAFHAEAQTRYEQGIRSFQVKENLIKNDKLAIIATDSAGNPQEQINGTFQFVINGFQQEIKFNDGVGVAPQAVGSSAFVFIKHQNQFGSTGQLYYVVKNDQGIRPIHISWYYLIVIPLIIIIVGYLFKRLFLLAIIVVVGLFLFNYSKGLDLQNLMDTIVHGLRGWVNL